jgi:hypothetical protein
MIDLFSDAKTMKDQLKDWILSRKWTKSHEVLEWGMKAPHFTTRADRMARLLAEEGFIRRMTDDEKKAIAYYGKEEIWVPV